MKIVDTTEREMCDACFFKHDNIIEVSLDDDSEVDFIICAACLDKLREKILNRVARSIVPVTDVETMQNAEDQKETT